MANASWAAIARRAVVPVLAFILGCTGSIEPSGEGSVPAAPRADDGFTTAPRPASPARPAEGSAPPVRPPSTPPGAVSSARPVVRRLNRVEYDNTIRDLLGDDSRPAADFPPDELKHGFDNDGSALTIPPALAHHYVLAAEALAARARPRLAQLLPCAASGDDACAAGFVRDFGERAFRRPLDRAEEDLLMAAVRTGRTGGSFADGIELVIRTALVSPRFLFRIEMGAGPPAAGVVQLDGWELATRLSYLFWESLPDAPLRAAARGGALSSASELERQARRLLADPRARATAARFHEMWLGLAPLATLNKDAALFPRWQPGVSRRLGDELRRMIEDAVFARPVTLAALFAGDTTFLDPELARFYGIAAPMAAGAQRVSLPPADAAGILGRAGLLAIYAHPNQTSPVRRGQFVREALLCQKLPPPPPTVNDVLPAPDPTRTQRERMAVHRNDPSCASCHDLIDPIGLGFEKFDAIGLPRAIESGRAVSTAGELIGAGDATGSFDGLPALGARLARSADVRRCVLRQWLQFALGRSLEAREEPELGHLADLVGRAGTVTEALVALVRTPMFTTLPVDMEAP